MAPNSNFLPVTREDMELRGWDGLDFLYISGDAYVDHPSFGHAILTRLLESKGYRVGIIPQPDWKNAAALQALGRPRLAVLISSGVIDSMVNHYTASKKKRSTDAYSPGGVVGKRPDRAVIVYANKIREVFKDIPVIIGGTEASLRRFAHYDYWDDQVRRSILLDSQADLLIYGMGEKPLLEIVVLLDKGVPIGKLTGIRGTTYAVKASEGQNFMNQAESDVSDKKSDAIILPSFEEVKNSRHKYARAFQMQSQEQDAVTGKVMVQPHGDWIVVQNPPVIPLSVEDMDRIYSLPYERNFHPMYEQSGGIPAINEVKFSITSHRGCFGGCSFCALNFHQGRAIQKRSQASIIQEARKLTWLPDFKGYIHDVGGPTANFRSTACERQKKHGVCSNKQCLHPEACRNLIVDHREYLALLRELRELPGIKKVFVRSGIRYDYLMLDKDDTFFNELCEHHISGQLKVAPEHVSDRVLKIMGKSPRAVYDRFSEKFKAVNKKLGKEQYLVPYLLSSHPGSELKDAVELAEYLKKIGYMPEQVQDFYPTPGSLSTCMFYTGLDPRTMKEIHVPRSPREKALQRALLQFGKPENYNLVYEALVKADRKDLIGFGPQCLIRPRPNRKISEGKVPARVATDNRKAANNRKKADNRKAVDRKTTAKGEHKTGQKSTDQRIGMQGKRMSENRLRKGKM